MTIYQIFVTICIIAALAFWFVQLIDLMSRKDNEFPGRFDKPTWVLILVLTNFIGALAFFISKPEKLEELSPDIISSNDDKSITCVVCGYIIPSGITKCSSCGWTYEKKET